jgi:hypothetical protein
MHTVKNKSNQIRVEHARLTSANQAKDTSFVQAMKQNTPTKYGQAEQQPGFMNLRLLGRVYTTLETQSIQGATKVKLNIGKVSAAREKILNSALLLPTQQMTVEDKSINEKSILIPSFSTTSTIFNQHFIILKDLRKRIDGLKKAYFK